MPMASQHWQVCAWPSRAKSQSGLMLGGNISGETRVVSVQIYDHVEAMEYAQAHWLAGGMVAFSFIVLMLLHWLQPRGGR